MNEEPSNNQQNQQQPPVPQGLPAIQLQIPTIAAPQQPVSNTQALLESNKDFVSQGNQAEEKVALQIILISSAILAIISGVGITKENQNINVAFGILLILAVLGLGVSLISGVLHFISERKFWYKNWMTSSDALKMIQTMANPAERENAALVALANTEPSSNRIAFGIQIVSFLIGVVALLIIIVTAIIIRL
jgi:hypothetical protein